MKKVRIEHLPIIIINNNNLKKKKNGHMIVFGLLWARMSYQNARLN